MKRCKGCKEPIARKRLTNGRLEHKVHFEKRVYHDNDCKLMMSTQRAKAHYRRY